MDHKKKNVIIDFVFANPTILTVFLTTLGCAIMSLVFCFALGGFEKQRFIMLFKNIYIALFAPCVLHEIICFFFKSFRDDEHSFYKSMALYYTPFIMYFIAKESLYIAAGIAFVLMAIILLRDY